MEATSGAAAARVERRRMAMPNGWWGAILFIATEATLFGCLIATYFYLRFNNAHWPPLGVEPPKVALPLILTGVLVSTTIPIFFAGKAARAGNARLAWILFFVALLLQGGYFGVQVHEFLSDLDKMSPHDSAYASIYFTLIGAHHAHVVVGMLIEIWVLAKLLGGLTNYRLIGVRVAAFYWYFVNFMAVAVVLTQIYPSL
jgi:cytochrome c oxidase subunit 3/cytochrome c oxidase subunit I+III